MKVKYHKISNRSGLNACEICKTKTFLEIHHINGRKIPKYNEQSNIVNVCPNCHSEIHWGKIIIEGWFYTTNGYELFWHHRDESSLSGKISSPHIIHSK